MPVVALTKNLDPTLTKPMPTPSRPELSAWFRGARAVLPMIPDPTRSDWFLKSSVITLQEVKFELYNAIGESATVIIDR
jgi:hypothetical protein